MPNIVDYYDSKLFETAGTAIVNRDALADRFKGGLFNLVFDIVYNKELRDKIRDLRRTNNMTDEQIRQSLISIFRDVYGVTGMAQEALIAVHFAGMSWVEAYNKNDVSERDKQEAIFKQQLAVVSWLLWEQGTGPLFPLPW